MSGYDSRPVAFISHALKLKMAARHTPLGMLTIRPYMPAPVGTFTLVGLALWPI